jgi:hypothetical protein
MESERLDSSALGSLAPSTELDTEVVVHAMDNADSQASAVTKLSRTQESERKEHAASELADVLRQRKFKTGYAEYWDQLADSSTASAGSTHRVDGGNRPHRDTAL